MMRCARWSLAFLWMLQGLAAIACAQTPKAPNTLWVAVGDHGRRISSTDGILWANDVLLPESVPASERTLRSVCTDGTRFVAAGGGPTTGLLLASSDGRNWEPLASPAPALAAIAATSASGSQPGTFVAAHPLGLIVSSDGHHFDHGARFPVTGHSSVLQMAQGNGEGGPRFVILGSVSLGGLTSFWRAATEDGTTLASFTQDAPPASSIAYGSGHFVAVGPAGLLETSHDGHQWQRIPTDPAVDFQQVLWSGRRFLAIGPGQAWSSDDGLAWNRAPHSPSHLLLAISETSESPDLHAWSASEGSLFVSTDLLTWKPANVAFPLSAPLRAAASLRLPHPLRQP